MSRRVRYFIKRLLLAIPVVVFGTTVTFIALRMGPIDPAAAIVGETGGAADRANVRRSLGLHRPLWQQYIDFMVDLFTLDLGQSWVIQRGRSVTDLLWIYAPRTIWLAIWSIMIAIFVGVPLGFYAGLNPNSWGDYTASFGGIIWLAMPNFWLAVILLALLRQSERYLGFNWHTLGPEINSLIGQPPMDFIGITSWMSIGFLSIPAGLHFSPGTAAVAFKQVAPAAFVLGSAMMASELRIGRTAVLETINSNYVETAKAKGLPNRIIVWKHVFRNALIPLVPVISSEFSLLLGGSIIVEVIFGINGLGFLFYQALLQSDLPMLGSLMFILIIVGVSMNILQDFLYTVLDPRVGYE